MNRIAFAGGIYPDARPGGIFAVPVPSQGIVKTHVGNIPYPEGEDREPGLMFLRLSAVSTLKFAAKSHSSLNLHVWQNGGWTIDGRDSYGTQGHIWSPDGVLVVQEYHGPGTPSQGYRYWDKGMPIAGDATYNNQTALAHLLGITEMYAWTERDGIAVGQGAAQAAAGGIVVQINGTRRLLETGPCTFIEFHRDGNSVAIAFCKPGEAVVIWATVAELAALPIYPDTPVVEPPPIDPPPVDPEGPVDTDLDRLIFNTLQQIRHKYPQPLSTDVEKAKLEKGGLLNEAAWIVSRQGFTVGLETKSGDNTAIQPGTGIKIGNDIIQTEENGRWGRDFLSSTGPGEDANPVMGRKGEADPARFVPPVDPQTGEEPTEPEPPPVDDELEARVEALEKQTDALDDQINSQDNGLKFQVENLEARVVALESAPPSGGLTPAERKTLADAQALLTALKNGFSTGRSYGHSHNVQWEK